MKKTIMVLLALTGVGFSSQATADELDNTWLITFTDSATTYTADFLGNTGVTWNAVGATASTIVNANGGTSSLTIENTNGAVAGEKGALTGQGTFDAIVDSYFNTNSLTTTSPIRPFNAYDWSSTTFTLGGLTSGETYTMTVLFARGNDYNGSSSVQRITMSGAKDVTASVLSQNGNDKAIFDGSTLKSSVENGTLNLTGTNNNSSNNVGKNWILAQYSFTASDAGTVALSGTGLSIAGIALQAPEPATATLSLLALAGLAARRRRK